MKNKIATKLIVYVAVILLTFALILGIAFTFLSSWHVNNVQRDDLTARAQRIATTMSEFYNTNGTFSGYGKRGGGFGAYMRFLDEIAMSDVWVIDSKTKDIIRSHGGNEIRYQELPPDARVALEMTLDKGQLYSSESFSGIMQAEHLTISAPIYASDSEIVGAVLLHAPATQTETTIQNSIALLLGGIVIALALSLFPTIFLSLHISKPIKAINSTTQQIMVGNYAAKANVNNQDEIGQLAHSINNLSEKLRLAGEEREKLEQMKQDFISNVSHELRTPVTVLRGSIEALRSGVVDTPEREQEYLDQMLCESIHMQRLVNDLLELSRLQNSNFSIEMQTIDLHEVVLDATQSMRQIAKNRQITLELDDELPSFLMQGDYSRIRQMLLTVLDNAVKFSASNATVKIHIAPAPEKTAHVSIHDTGPGIEPEEMPYLFERFQKLRYEGNKQGTGLGLAIAKQIADRHGIEIAVHSQSGEGSEFLFTFPSIESYPSIPSDTSS